MRLWRLIRTGHTALDGAWTSKHGGGYSPGGGAKGHITPAAGHAALDGAWTSKHGGRYSPAGAPMVNFASEAGLAVLVALRYPPDDPAEAPDDYVLGWTEIDAIPESIRDADGDDAIREWVTDWLEERRTLL